MPDRDSNLPGRTGRGTAGGDGQVRAQRLSVLAPAQRTPAVRLEPHLDALAAARTATVRHPVLLPVLRAAGDRPDRLPAFLELVDRFGEYVGLAGMDAMFVARRSVPNGWRGAGSGGGLCGVLTIL